MQSYVLGSIGTDCDIGESCYNGTILQRNYRKMTMKWSFSYNSFIKFHGKKFGSHNMTVLYPNPCFNEVCYKEIALYISLCRFVVVVLMIIFHITANTLSLLLETSRPEEKASKAFYPGNKKSSAIFYGPLCISAFEQ